jgi:hypothetical protein
MMKVAKAGPGMYNVASNIVPRMLPMFTCATNIINATAQLNPKENKR